MMSDLIDAYERDPSPRNLNALESALMVTGPLLYRSHVYGIADARAVESFERFSNVRRAELVRIP